MDGYSVSITLDEAREIIKNQENKGKLNEHESNASKASGRTSR